MHPRYAAIFGIESLELNQYFRSDSNVQPVVDDKHSAQGRTDNDLPIKALNINPLLLADINQAIAPQTITHIIQSAHIAWHGATLSLPSAQLTPDHKRALWALMSKTRDNL